MQDFRLLHGDNGNHSPKMQDRALLCRIPYRIRSSNRRATASHTASSGGKHIVVRRSAIVSYHPKSSRAMQPSAQECVPTAHAVGYYYVALTGCVRIQRQRTKLRCSPAGLPGRRQSSAANTAPTQQTAPCRLVRQARKFCVPHRRMFPAAPTMTFSDKAPLHTIQDHRRSGANAASSHRPLFSCSPVLLI